MSLTTIQCQINPRHILLSWRLEVHPNIYKGPDIFKNGNILELKQLIHVHTAREDNRKIRCSETLPCAARRKLTVYPENILF